MKIIRSTVDQQSTRIGDFAEQYDLALTVERILRDDRIDYRAGFKQLVPDRTGYGRTEKEAISELCEKISGYQFQVKGTGESIVCPPLKP